MYNLLGLLLFFSLASSSALAKTRYYDWVIKEVNYTRLCQSKKILTVNGLFPGPTINARKGDTVIVKISNHVQHNITIHWHGVDQPRDPWHDGPEYITQCPIRGGANFTYKVQLTFQEGTLWWHAHSDWDRATVNGAIIVHPRVGDSFPFAKPHEEIPIILGQWWKGNITQILADALRTGGNPAISDSFLINGKSGTGMYVPCSRPGDTFKTVVEHGKSYLLRVINAAINNELFFAVADHNLTVVGKDGSYLKPLTVSYIMITPGQTMDILLHANQHTGLYYMAAKAYASAVGVQFDTTVATAVLEYKNVSRRYIVSTPSFPSLPSYDDNDAVTNFTAGLRSLASKHHPVNVPQTVDKQIVITVSVNLIACPNATCQGPNGDRLAASLNNISFAAPSISVLDAYYRNISGVYGNRFPDRPPVSFNFTGDNLPTALLYTRKGTEARVLEYNTSVEIVFQGTNLLAGENHPMHLHGQSFYVVGRGFGNYNRANDTASYNLVDPPYENTVGVYRNGWAAIRFRATNPGVWFMHCHIDRHMSWGMDAVFIVKNGATPDAQMLPPPPDMPGC